MTKCSILEDFLVFSWESKESIGKKWVNTAWKVSVFWVFLVRIFWHLYWIQTDTPYLSECGKIRTRKSPNTDTFHAVRISEINLFLEDYWPEIYGKLVDFFSVFPTITDQNIVKSLTIFVIRSLKNEKIEVRSKSRNLLTASFLCFSY